jgi:Protein of unknown function (DUF2970).
MEVIKMVLSGAVGIRRKSSHERAKVSPWQLVVAAVVFVLLFILAIRTVVYVVTS